METHYISGVWFDLNDKITSVLLHPINTDGTFQFGEKAPLSQLTKAIRLENAVVSTIIWNYTYASRATGPVVFNDNESPDQLKLENLIKMNALISF